jgi:hypothetical protein
LAPLWALLLARELRVELEQDAVQPPHVPQEQHALQALRVEWVRHVLLARRAVAPQALALY